MRGGNGRGGPGSAGRARETARRVIRDALAATDEGVSLWPTTNDGKPRVPSGIVNMNENLETNSVDGRVIKPTSISDTHVNGQFSKGKISSNDRWGPREISVPGLTDNPDSDAGRAVDARSFADRNREVNDALASRATNAEVNNALNVAQAKTSAAQVKALIRKHVKKNSTQGL